MRLMECDGDVTAERLQGLVDGWACAHGRPVLPVIMLDGVSPTVRDAVDRLTAHRSGGARPATLCHDDMMPAARPGVRETRLGARLERLRDRLAARNDAWWAEHRDEAPDGLVPCPGCGSRVAAARCGAAHGWRNHCPVCGADMRPRPVRERFDAWKREYVQVREERDTLRRLRRRPVFTLVLLDPDDTDIRIGWES
ncbi:hypothetical protein [Bifidobacterium castoris]|uniref:Uncharacterized protein n=1 Tax=Bifidobacterium castoris TaxID=2306972 RepID=A0A430FA98_9BIFI|nr:hypothetical protein [Bifidobacterium castoris]RSX49749.1 hypothetical protein D2E22_0210 [Bifidobacterium castoris]